MSLVAYKMLQGAFFFRLASLGFIHATLHNENARHARLSTLVTSCILFATLIINYRLTKFIYFIVVIMATVTNKN